ncbi:filamentous hemagglutinin N-terminal domain-containing protein [Thermochromatium tepidum]|nr:filamentous hemagglutinin N-terminal domain-containing protein [Thermochromatium tepidum]
MAGILLLDTSVCLAQIITDGTVGPAMSLSGPEMTIGAELGSTRGANLFHSFQRFDIPTGHQATFTGPDQIQNVIGRVTGGQTSHIDGTLRSTVGQADVYLINPSGVVLGPNARVDVPAALHLSTADELRFSDGSRYSASDPAGSTLTLAAPESFGFLAPQPASLTIEGSQLELKPGKAATLTAGDVGIVGTSERRASLKAPGGEVRIEAIGDRVGQVSVSTPTKQPGSGRLSLDQAQIETSGAGGGRIQIRAGEADLRATSILTDNTGAIDASAGIDILVSGRLQLRDQTGVSSDALSMGDAGSVSVNADRLELLNGSWISSSTYAQGAGGEVHIQAGSVRLDGFGVPDQFTWIASGAAPGSSGEAGRVSLTVAGLLEVLNGALISSSTWGVGKAGGVTISAGSLRLDDFGMDQFTGIWSDTNTDSGGDAGTVSLRVAGLLEVLNGAAISSSTQGSGQAGGVTISAGSLRLDGLGAPDRFTGIASQAIPGSSGEAGTISLTVEGLLEVLNGAEISSSTGGLGQAGEVTISAGSLRLDGLGAPNQATGIATQASEGSSGEAGTISLTVEGLLEVLNGAQISSSTFGLGKAGEITIAADSIRLDGLGALNQFTGVVSSASSDTSGDAGRVSLTVEGLLEVLNGAVISSSTWGVGKAGGVTISAGSLRLDGLGAPDQFTGIASEALLDSSGEAGTVSLSVDELLEVLNGAEISSSTFGLGKAGEVMISAGSMRLDGLGAPDEFTGIASRAGRGSSSDAGRVSLTVDGLLEVLNGARLSTSTLATGDAGDLSIKARHLLILGPDSGAVSAAYSSATGQVGNLVIETDTLSLADGGILSIEAQQTVTDPGQVSADRTLKVKANRFWLDGGVVVASSTGNVPAAAIQIQADELRLANDSRITTEAAQADAGPISIGGGRLWLADSLITTSANGAVGDGGDIKLTPEYLILDGGFIQANTAAVGARGGDIRIDTRALIASQSLVEIGGAERQTFTAESGRNIIQAAAPGGEQGTIEVTSPDLDLTSALVPLASPFSDPDELFTDLCRTLNEAGASSLVERGYGGLPPAPAPTAISFTPERLDRLNTASSGALE